MKHSLKERFKKLIKRLVKEQAGPGMYYTGEQGKPGCPDLMALNFTPPGTDCIGAVLEPQIAGNLTSGMYIPPGMPIDTSCCQYGTTGTSGVTPNPGSAFPSKKTKPRKAPIRRGRR